MIVGAHSVIYSKDPDADRAFLRDVLAFPHVDVGGGWLIFGLPPAEVATHPSEENEVHEFFLMCDDVEAFVADMGGRGVACAAIESPPWGRLTRITLPGGGKVGVYEPRHARPASKPRGAPRRSASRASGSRRPPRARAKPSRRSKRTARRPAKRAARRR